MASDILIVDDEADIRDLVAGVLEDEGYTARTAADSDAALAALDERRPSLVLLDVWLQGSRLDGLDLLRRYVLAHEDDMLVESHGLAFPVSRELSAPSPSSHLDFYIRGKARNERGTKAETRETAGSDPTTKVRRLKASFQPPADRPRF